MNQARRAGGEVETSKKYGAGGNKQSGAAKNTATLDQVEQRRFPRKWSAPFSIGRDFLSDFVRFLSGNGRVETWSRQSKFRSRPSKGPKWQGTHAKGFCHQGNLSFTFGEQPRRGRCPAGRRTPPLPSMFPSFCSRMLLFSEWRLLSFPSRIQINEKPQVVNEYEQGKAIPNQQIIGKMERTLGVKLRGKGKMFGSNTPGAYGDWFFSWFLQW